VAEALLYFNGNVYERIFFPQSGAHTGFWFISDNLKIFEKLFLSLFC